ncbi:CLUMA_CG001404, isoform A [Clunio marinus]|uniref:DNA primase large subunit n=1 Tax=Clunio marinus TaxID=568069 RepID=A0A1J1HHU2_9DIPT|nr:CLUMA_CG001404, isoform A [Clunio marinus]
MDFPKKSKIKVLKSPDEQSLDTLLPHNCLFYILPPMIDVSLKDFEDLAIERLKLLRILEQAGVKHPKILSDEWKEHVINELNIAGLKYFVRLLRGNGNTEQDMNARRRDYLSHFILRFAYCRSEDLRRWFIAREMELFRFKFSSLSSKEVKEYVELYEMGYRPISEDQKQEVRQELQSSVLHNIDGIDFYKVSFLAVLDLVRQRKCFLKNGFAYVSSMDFSIGVTLEDSLRFWREEFTKTIEPDKFDKSYAYGIRYNYGKEGSRTNWSPHSCMKVINTQGTSQDACGCPFKLWDASELRTRLVNYGINPVNVQDVISLATKGHFQIACSRYFELTHNTKLDEGISHPNGYFENSQILMENREPKSKTPQMSQQNQRRQHAMTQQQNFKRKLEARVKAEHDYDEELWKLSEQEEQRMAELKSKEKAQIEMELSQLESMDWDDDDDNVKELSDLM